MSNNAETESWTDKIWKYINVFLNPIVVYIIISMYSLIQLGEQEKKKEIVEETSMRTELNFIMSKVWDIELDILHGSCHIWNVSFLNKFVSEWLLYAIKTVPLYCILCIHRLNE